MRFALIFLLTVPSFAQIQDLAYNPRWIARIFCIDDQTAPKRRTSLASKIFGTIDSTGAYLIDDEGTVALGESY